MNTQSNAPAQLKVLLVEDDNTLRKLVARALKDRGYEINEAKSGNEAIDHFKSQGIDLIISDVNMPDGDGLWLLKTIRNSGSTVPFIFLTGSAAVSKATALSLGATGFLGKPVNTQTIVDAIQESLAKCASQKA